MKPMLVLIFLTFLSAENIKAQNVPPAPLPVETADSARYKDIIFSRVEVEASFPGGDEGWRQYLMKTLRPERIVDLVKFPRGKKTLKQTVIVKFIVARDGTLAEITAENYAEVDPYCAAEAIRVIKISPNWVPAVQNGRKVNAYRRQPISFVFER